MIKALLWLEWRQKQRMFFCLLGVILLMLGVVAVVRTIPDTRGLLQAILVFMLLFAPIIYSFGMGINMFGELPKQNSSFLLGLPVSTNRIFWS